MHSRRVLSFLATVTIGNAQGIWQGWIIPSSKILVISCLFPCFSNSVRRGFKWHSIASVEGKFHHISKAVFVRKYIQLSFNEFFQLLSLKRCRLLPEHGSATISQCHCKYSPFSGSSSSSTTEVANTEATQDLHL